MIDQETYVRIHDLHRQGWTCKEIAAETGLHPSTVSKYLKADGPPITRLMPDSSLVMNAVWKERTALLITKFPRLLGISVHNKLRADGFRGGYSTVTRELRVIRGPRFRAAEAASMPIHTDPGEEAQFDFCDLSDWAARWGWPTPLWCFGMILCWSRWRMWWFTTSEDREHTFEGIARFFDTAGGIPARGAFGCGAGSGRQADDDREKRGPDAQHETRRRTDSVEPCEPVACAIRADFRKITARGARSDGETWCRLRSSGLGSASRSGHLRRYGAQQDRQRPPNDHPLLHREKFRRDGGSGSTGGVLTYLMKQHRSAAQGRWLGEPRPP